jgi:hypothetical protein
MPSIPLSNSSNRPGFQAYQIVCLDYEDTCLYAEVVQLVEDRQVCWVRPLVLHCALSAAAPQWLDLRNCSDLLLPWVLFRAAMDTEAIPILAHMYSPKTTDEDESKQVSHQVHQFIQKICRAHPEAF